MKLVQPIVFEPILIEKIWGGQSLKNLGKQLPPDVKIGESWEVADIPNCEKNRESIVAEGPWVGWTLSKLIKEYGDQLLGASSTDNNGCFPLLIKFLDACDNLSVQVHPSEKYVAKNENTFLKTEAWIVLDSKPNSYVYAGFKKKITKDILRTAISSNTIVDLLHRIRVSKGDIINLPSGTCHALGAGIMVAEIQTPSDTTFRVWDWGRQDRTLHIQEAIECVDLDTGPIHCTKSVCLEENNHFKTDRILKNQFFKIDQITVKKSSNINLTRTGTVQIIICTDGEAVIESNGSPVICSQGGTVTIPAASDNVLIRCGKYASSFLIIEPKITALVNKKIDNI